MTKILSRSGDSLADIYDAEGSIAGIDQLQTSELPIMHEMGATVFSERFTTRVFRIPTGDLAQNIDFDVELATLPETPARLLAVQVITDSIARVLRCAVLATDPRLGQDIPLWMFDTVAAAGESVNLSDATVFQTVTVLLPRPSLNVFPAFVGGREQQDSMVSSVTLTGRTTGFGAGTVFAVALLLLAFPRRDVNISSRGLPIPSW